MMFAGTNWINSRMVELMNAILKKKVTKTYERSGSSDSVPLGIHMYSSLDSLNCLEILIPLITLWFISHITAA